MDEDEDDLYGAAQPEQIQALASGGHYSGVAHIKNEDLEDGEEEGEEIEEDDSDSEIDIITERKPTSRPELATQASRQEVTQAEPSHAIPIERPTSRAPPATIKTETPHRVAPPQRPGSQYPEVHTSTVDVNVVPTYDPAGKLITELEFDADLAEHEKPWRRPGSDQSDYFNYGFDEFTWATYCLKQKNMRETINTQKAESAKFEMMFGGGPGMPSMGMPGGGPGGVPTAPSVQQQQQSGVASQQQFMDQSMGGMPGMPGMPEMSPDMMNAMMQQMMQSGVDPGQMDFGSFMQQMQQMQGGGANAGGPQPGAYGGQSQGSYAAGGGGGGGRKGRRW